VIYLLDTNILIYLIKNQPPAIAERIDALSEDDSLCMSFITWASCSRAPSAARARPTC
jgi:tRNA(fMet)-specific endonuclease VapC